MQSQIRELTSFLKMNERLDVQITTLQIILDLTGNTTTLESIYKAPELLQALVDFLGNSVTSKLSALNLVNISANEKGAEALLNHKITEAVLKEILAPESIIADPCCMILSNITRPKHLAEVVAPLVNILEVINAFTKTKFNNHGQTLYYLGPVLSNLSQTKSVRKLILHEDNSIIHRLLPFTEYSDSLIKRGGVIGTLRNCCFENSHHDWLLSESVDILPHLLLPLAGNDEFDEEDNDKLPLELQYLSNNKKREEDPDIRCMIMEALIQLCSTRVNREFIRNKNAYVILRQLHKWETDRKCLATCESLVNILIRTEEEIGVENLNEVEVPEHLQEKFNQEIKE